MKINFNRRPVEPDVDNNVKVQYAPAKRRQFQIRWYLILALVASPFVYVFWSLFMGWFIVESPGYIEIPTYQMTAPVAGIVENIFVKENQIISKGSPLIQIDKPNAKERLKILRDETMITDPKTLYEKEVNLDKKSLKDYESLHQAGAATTGEVEVARLRLIQLLALGQRWQTQIVDTEISAQSITLKAPRDSIVIKVETQNGVNVQAGEPLITIQETTKPRVIALLAPRFALYAHPGQTASIQWESGLKVDATVLYEGTISTQIPEKMQNFRNKGQGVVAQLELQSAIPGELAVNNLPVKVIFSRSLF